MFVISTRAVILSAAKNLRSSAPVIPPNVEKSLCALSF